MKNYSVGELNFYITNECNLSCDNCCTYNNLNLSGHKDLSKSILDLKKWSEILDIDRIYIMGGETLLHPDLDSWVRTVRELWTECKQFRISTNGLNIKRNKHQLRQYLETDITLEINVHDPKFLNKVFNDVDDLLSTIDHERKDIQEEHEHVDGSTFIENNTVYISSDGRILVEVLQSWDFILNSVKEIKNNTIFLYQSDPVVAFENCYAKICHYMVDGRFYLCKTTAMAKTLESQFNIDIDSKELHSRSSGVSPFDSQEVLDQFFQNLTTPIEQCRLCPENPVRDKVSIWPVKKVKKIC
jgi:hypothetical protein